MDEERAISERLNSIDRRVQALGDVALHAAAFAAAAVVCHIAAVEFALGAVISLALTAAVWCVVWLSLGMRFTR